MPFKINISHKGKTIQIETESEAVVGKKIEEKIKGEDISNELAGYELKITGTSDISGIPGFKTLEGAGYHRRLLTYGPGMKNRKKGIRLRKTNRGEEVSLKTSQINTIVIKEGDKKFNTLIKKPKTEEEPKEETKEEKEEKPAEKSEAPTEQAKPSEETLKEASDTKEKEEKKE